MRASQLSRCNPAPAFRRLLAAACVAVVGCGGQPIDDPAQVPPGGTASYQSDGGRAAILVTYPETGLVRGANRFVFQPLDGATLTTLTAMMPAHGHRWTSALTPDGDGFVAEVDLMMPGRWELTAGVQTDAGADQLRFSFIVP